MDASERMTLVTAREGSDIIVHARGELDFSTMTRLMETIEQAAGECSRACVVDCENVTFIDSETLKCLLMLNRRLTRTGRTLYLRNCSRQVERILVLLGLWDDLCASR